VDTEVGVLPTEMERSSPGMQISAEYVGKALGFARRQLAELISSETMA
jgi:hypothetical protein